LPQAQAQMAEIQAGIGRIYPVAQNIGILVTPLLDQLVGRVRTTLYFLMGAVMCLLLIGGANLANLLVARSMARSQELVVRAALAAHKSRLIMQSIMERVPVVFLGGRGGLILTRWLLSLLVPLLPSTMPRLDAIRVDWQVLLFAFGVLIATAMSAAIWP